VLHDLKTLWKIKRFRILLTARTLSNIGNGMSPIAMAFGVLSLPGSNASSLSWVTASHMVPIVLFLLLGGVVADRMDEPVSLELPTSSAVSSWRPAVSCS
jgi:hypothetical protein